MSVEALRALLPACAARGIPMLVANPDVVTVDAEMLVPMPGMLAQVSLLSTASTYLCHAAVLVPSCSASCDRSCLEQHPGPRVSRHVFAMVPWQEPGVVPEACASGSHEAGSGLVLQALTFVRQWYEELGGEVVLLGKPAAVLYEEALRMLGLRKDEVLAIGDSLQHDIAGAAPPR